MNSTPYQFTPIAYLRSPFQDRYGVPRQPSVAGAVRGTVQFYSETELRDALKTIEQFSHLWVIFVFHAHGGKRWRPTIRPPRLGGRVRVGVLASRSPHRPNPLGLSVVKIEKVDLDAPEGPQIEVSGVDLLDGTPILDIKPYLSYTDSLPQALSGWASAEVKKIKVSWSLRARDDLARLPKAQAEELEGLIGNLLELDPRPAYQQRKTPAGSPELWGRLFGMKIAGHEIKYTFQAEGLLVQSID
jgi:tRNA-Thr(GGU) m(6)t(6)A37 methyltransferase TsaA